LVEERPRFRVEVLGERERDAFSCGSPELDRYFARLVTQDVRRRLSNCFVAVEVTTLDIAGFYTISAASIALPDLPPALTKKLPRYPMLPAVRVGRLGIDLRYRGIGLGGALLADAIERSLRAEVAAFAVLVDAKDDAAVAFYEHHGFERLTSQLRTLFLPLATARKAAT
jgi:GNAT superfamily N-acetyltransferase